MQLFKSSSPHLNSQANPTGTHSSLLDKSNYSIFLCFLQLARRRCLSEQNLGLNLPLSGQVSSGFLQSDYGLHPGAGWDHGLLITWMNSEVAK